MRKNKANITELQLVKYLHGEVCESEQVSIANAISCDSDLRRHFQQLQLVWDESRKVGMNSAVNVDEAWARFKLRVAKGQKVETALPGNKWLKAAAVLLLLVGGCLLAYYKLSHEEAHPVVALSRVPGVIPAAIPPIPVKNEAERPEKQGPKKQVISVAAKKSMNASGHAEQKLKEVCNSTAVPLEICIIQKLNCPDGRSSIVATCNKLEPDEANKLRYKNFDKAAVNCHATVDEITIKKVATGETIVLNAESKPLSAGELFSYISGQKKGDVLAGTFDTDCLAFDSKSGDFVLQQCPPGNEENCN